MLLWRVMEKGILNPSLGRLFYYSGHGASCSQCLCFICAIICWCWLTVGVGSHCSLCTESVQKWLEANVDIDAGTIGYKGRMSCH